MHGGLDEKRAEMSHQVIQTDEWPLFDVRITKIEDQKHRSELLGENIIINRIFLINPSKAKESDLYLGDISIIDGNSVAIKSWEKAVLGNVREFESNSNDIFDIIMRELENDK